MSLCPGARRVHNCGVGQKLSWGVERGFLVLFGMPEAGCCGENDLCAGGREAERVGELKVEEFIN